MVASVKSLNLPSNLAGKTALVTGGARGIGRAAAMALGRAGAQVLVHYNASSNDAESVANAIRRAGSRAEKIGVDLAGPHGPHELAQKARAIVGERLDILVINARISSATSIEEVDLPDFDRLFALNVRASFFLVQQLLPILGEGASVIFTSALAANAAIGNLSAYAIVKGAADTMVRDFATMLGSRGVRVNSVAPAAADAELPILLPNGDGRNSLSAPPMPARITQPEDVGSAVAFLASDAARWITGESLRVGAGAKA